MRWGVSLGEGVGKLKVLSPSLISIVSFTTCRS